MSSGNGKLSIESLEDLLIAGIESARERWKGIFIVPDGLLQAFRKAVLAFTEAGNEAAYQAELERINNDIVGHQHRFFFGQHIGLKGEVRSGQPFDQPRKGQVDRVLGLFTQYVREEGGRHRFEASIDDAARLLHESQTTLRALIGEQKKINAQRAAEAERQRKIKRLARTKTLLERAGIGTSTQEPTSTESTAEVNVSAA